jgi:AraC-like DNA-binding protein
MVVKSELEKLGLYPISVELGEVEINSAIDDKEKEAIKITLASFGFELLESKKSIVIEKVKNAIIDLVHNKNNELNSNLSDHLSKLLLQEYSSISTLFSEVEGITIEQYFIAQKIERVKELLVYNELTLSEIAFQLNYSSTAHLSNQFKKVTGFTPSYFKQLKDKKRKQIEDL